MRYNLLIKTYVETYSILGLEEERLKKVVESYEKGEKGFTLAGTKYSLDRVMEFKIFTSPPSKTDDELIEIVKKQIDLPKNFFGQEYFDEKILKQIGKNVTYDFIGDKKYGTVKKKVAAPSKKSLEKKTKTLIHPERIAELEKINSKDFDLTRLIQYCKEINDNFDRGNYLSVIGNCRSIINHIPPIFDFNTFNEVANNYGGKSFKKSMNHLNISMRSIADSYLHDTIRKKESLPNETQINFSQDLDVLIAEIIRKLGE